MTNEQKLNYFRKALPEIQQLQAHELDEFLQEKSSWNLPSDVLKFLTRAIDTRRKEVFTSMTTADSMAVHSNISVSDL